MNFLALARTLALLSALAGLLIVVRAPGGLWGGVIWLPKLLAGAWTPVVALLGASGALLGLPARDPLALLAGLFGLLASVRHTLRVTKEHDSFARAFGPDWQARLPAGLRGGSARRYRVVAPRPDPIPGQRDLDLGPAGEPLPADLWLPPADVSRSGLAILFLHGGLWQAFQKDFLTRPLFRPLASQGHAILDVSYALTPAANLERILADVGRAVTWLRAHATEHELNPERIVLMGVSGGAHLALLTAYARRHPALLPFGDLNIRAVISTSCISDLSAFWGEYGRSNPHQPELTSQMEDRYRPRVYDRTWLDRFMTRQRIFPAYRHGNMPGGPLLLPYLLGGTLREMPEVYALNSPMNHVGPHCPPTLLLTGDNDFAADASHSRKLHAALQAAGVPSVLVEFPDTVHAYDQYFGVSRRVAPAAQAAMLDIQRFLALMT